MHYGSFGYDLGINTQLVWKYSRFIYPTTTIAPFPDRTKFASHVELIYILIAPLYWLWSDPLFLIILQACAIASGAYALMRVAIRSKVRSIAVYAIGIGYVLFFGVQNAIWFDIHSSTFAAMFISWFIYALETKRMKMTWVFALLAMTSKENIGAIVGSISLVYFLRDRKALYAWLMAISFGYVLFVYLWFFPYIMHAAYLYANQNGLLSNLDPRSLIDTDEKTTTLAYTIIAFAGLPFGSVMALLPIIAHFFMFFVIGSDLEATQGIFMHYRVTLAPLLAWASIWTIRKADRKTQGYAALAILFTTLCLQYALHLPVSYLTKSWFWSTPASIQTIEKMIHTIPDDMSLAAQNNIIPHISNRKGIYSVYYERKNTREVPGCITEYCNILRIYPDADYLLVDLSDDWDARHYLADATAFKSAVHTMESLHLITLMRQYGTTRLYKITKEKKI
jgi:uncharacterized membrane protein